MVTPNLLDYAFFFTLVGGVCVFIWYFMGVETGKHRYIGPRTVLAFLENSRVTKFVVKHAVMLVALSIIGVGLTSIITPLTNGTFFVYHYYTEYGTPNQAERIMYDVSGFPRIFWGSVVCVIGIIIVCVKLFRNRK